MMQYQDKINSVIDSLELGEPIFDIKVRNEKISAKPANWEINLDHSDFTERMVKRCVERKYNADKRAFYIDNDTVIREIEDTIVNGIMQLFKACSPYDAPRRTKIYKDFTATVRRNYRNSKFINDLYNIKEYVHSVTQTDSITHRTNDVHRKNVYSLLCLMEKNYGEKTSN